MGVWLGFCFARARARGVSAAHAGESARSHARRRLFHPRARRSRGDDAMGEVMQQVNAMSATLARAAAGRARSHHAAAQGDGGDRRRRVRFRRRTSPAPGESRRRAAAESAGRAHAGRRRGNAWAWTIIWKAKRSKPSSAHFPGGTGTLGHRAAARSAKAACRISLLVVTDLTRPLREEELKAWQRLVRVLGHELNNSLAPIKSIAGSLENPAGARAARRTIGKTTCAAAWP